MVLVYGCFSRSDADFLLGCCGGLEQNGSCDRQIAGMASVVFDDNGKPVVLDTLTNVDQMQ